MQKMLGNANLDLEKVHSEKMMSSIAILKTMSKNANSNLKRKGESSVQGNNVIPKRKEAVLNFLSSKEVRLAKKQSNLAYIMMEDTTPNLLKTQSKILQKYLKFNIQDSSQNCLDDDAEAKNKNVCSLSEYEQHHRSKTNKICAQISRKTTQGYANDNLNINTGSLNTIQIPKKMNKTMNSITIDYNITPAAVEANSSQLPLIKSTSDNLEKKFKKEPTPPVKSSYLEHKNSIPCDNTFTNLEDVRTCTMMGKDYRKLYIVDAISDSELSSDNEISIEIDNYWILHPENKWLKWFRVLLFAVIVYMFVYEPILIAFYEVDPEPVRIISYVNDILFCLDVGLNFFIGYFDENEMLVLNQKKIAMNYLLSTFLSDTITAVPFGTLFNLTEESIGSNRVFKLSMFARIFKILRLLRLIKVMKYYFHKNIRDDLLKKIHVVRLSALGSLIQFLFGFVFFNHISTCLWIFLAKIDYPNWITEANLQESQSVEIYIASLYFNFATILSIGYGDIKSKSYAERLYNIFLMCFGVFLYSMVLSIVSNTVQKQDKLQKKRNKKSELMKEIVNKYKVQEQLSNQLGRYVKLYKAMNRYDKNLLLDALPKHLKNEIVFQMYQKNVRFLKFFQNTNNDEFKYRLACMLHLIRLKKNEYIIQAGDFIEEFYMIKKGVIQIEKDTYYNRKVKIAVLNENEHFGEVYMHLFIKSPVDFRVKSRIAEVFYLTKTDFLGLYADFPHIIASAMKVSWINAVRMENKARKIFKILKRQATGGGRMKNESYASPKLDSPKQDSKDHHKNRKRISKKLTTIHEEPEKGLINDKTNLPKQKSGCNSFRNSTKEKPLQKDFNPTSISQVNLLGECTDQGIQVSISERKPNTRSSFKMDIYNRTNIYLSNEEELPQGRNSLHNTSKSVFHLPLIDYKDITDNNPDRDEENDSDKNDIENHFKVHTKKALSSMESSKTHYFLKNDTEKLNNNEDILKDDSPMASVKIRELADDMRFNLVHRRAHRTSTQVQHQISDHMESCKKKHRSNSLHRLPGQNETSSENHSKKGKKHLSQPKNISGFMEIILNMQDINRALNNPKDLISDQLITLNNQRGLSEYEKQLDKISDIYDEILLGLFKTESSRRKNED